MNLSHINYHSLKLSMSRDHVIHSPKKTFIFTENSPNKISLHSGRTTRRVHRPTSTHHCPHRVRCPRVRVRRPQACCIRTHTAPPRAGRGRGGRGGGAAGEACGRGGRETHTTYCPARPAVEKTGDEIHAQHIDKTLESGRGDRGHIFV